MRPRPVDRLIRDLVRRGHARDQAPGRGEAGRDLDEDGGEQSGGGETVAKAGIEVAEDADGEGAEGVCDLGVAGEAGGGEVVDDVAGEGDEEHDGHLLEFALVDDDEAEGEGRDEDEGVPARVLGAADDVRGCARGDAAVEGGADGDAEAEEEGVDDGVNHADRAGDDVARLEFEGAADFLARLAWPEGGGEEVGEDMAGYDLRTIYPGRMRAMADWASAEKQKSSPLRMEPNARARKLVRTAAVISKILE